jgi:hypothetical protein
MDGNARADDLHQDPGKFRNQPATFVGTVYRSWSDDQVAEDRPWGIARVLRMLLYRSDWGPITESIDGKTERRTKLVSRLYEFAVVTDQPPPPERAEVRITGRFFKYRAIPVTPNPARDQANGVDQRQSDKVYTCFAVAAGYTLLPPPPLIEFSPLGFLLGACALVMTLVFWRLSRRDAAGAEKLQEQVRRLRATRRSLEERGKAPYALASSAAGPTVAAPGVAVPAANASQAPPTLGAPEAESGSAAPPTPVVPGGELLIEPQATLPAAPARSPTPPPADSPNLP